MRASPGHRDYCELTYFQARGRVRRLEPPVRETAAFEMAVQFLSVLKMEEEPA